MGPDTQVVVVRVKEAVEGFGDGAAVEEDLARVIRKHKPSIYSLCLRITCDSRQAVELTRDALREIYRRVPEIVAGDAPPWTWFFRITLRLAFDAVRRAGELLVDDGVVTPGSEPEAALRQLSQAERRDLLRRATAGLDPPLWEAVRLRYVENLPYEVIDAWIGDGSSHLVLTGLRPTLARELRSVLA